MKLTVSQLYQKMAQEMGPSGWWPANSKVEIIIGAILIQNTNWQNAELALRQLRAVTKLNPDQILKLSLGQLQELIRPAGFFRSKSKTLINVLTWLQQAHYNYPAIRANFGTSLRQELLNLHGIGPETADVLLTYIFDVPTFISDKYARTLFTCLGITGLTTYQSLAKRYQLSPDFTVAMVKDFHGLIDEFGKRYFHPLTKFQESFLAGVTLILR